MFSYTCKDLIHFQKTPIAFKLFKLLKLLESLCFQKALDSIKTTGTCSKDNGDTGVHNTSHVSEQRLRTFTWSRIVQGCVRISCTISPECANYNHFIWAQFIHIQTTPIKEEYNKFPKYNLTSVQVVIDLILIHPLNFLYMPKASMWLLQNIIG